MAPSSPRRSSACWILLAGAGCFLTLTLVVLLVDPFPGDAAARRWVLGYASPAVVSVAHVVNYLGNWRVLLPGTLLLLLVFPRARRRWWLWLGLMAVAPISEWLLKIAVGRARPEEASMGFPSGHATAAAAFFGAVIYLAEPLRPPVRAAVRAASVVLIVLVALARVVVRAHWPVDTLAGIALGLSLASIAAILGASERTCREPAEAAPPTPRRARSG